MTVQKKLIIPLQETVQLRACHLGKHRCTYSSLTLSADADCRYGSAQYGEACFNSLEDALVRRGMPRHTDVMGLLRGPASPYSSLPGAQSGPRCHVTFHNVL